MNTNRFGFLGFNATEAPGERAVYATGFAPIHNSYGEAIAVLGLELQADFVVEEREKVASLIQPLFVFLYVSGVIFIVITATIITRPIPSLTEAVQAIGQGDYEQDLSTLYEGNFSSEFSESAAAIEESGRVHIRKKQLSEKVEALEIQIDNEQRGKDVRNISESDFFKDLQSKACDMRESDSDDE